MDKKPNYRDLISEVAAQRTAELAANKKRERDDYEAKRVANIARAAKALRPLTDVLEAFKDDQRLAITKIQADACGTEYAIKSLLDHAMCRQQITVSCAEFQQWTPHIAWYGCGDVPEAERSNVDADKLIPLLTDKIAAMLTEFAT